MPTEYTWPLSSSPPASPPPPPPPPTPSVAAYARQLKALFPPGLLWLFDAGSWISKICLAIAEEFARIEARGADLLAEADPRTATETLEDWERVLGLPDGCIIALPDTDEERRLAVTQALVRIGGQTPAYYVALAAACGYTVTVYDGYASEVLRAGFRAGDRCNGVAAAHTWRVDVQPPAGAALSHAELECIITRAAPAHTRVFFEYL